MNNGFNQQQHDYANRVEQVLAAYMDQQPDAYLSQAMRYSLLAGGKRIRPFLVYATGQMFGTPLRHLDAPAAALEALHTYSLIHDDLPAMDDDDLRRGKPTCHIQFDEAHAILAGDALQTLAFTILAQTESLSAETRIAMISELALASGASGMCLGQSNDLLAEHKQVNLEQLTQIHRDKTGVIIRAAIRLGMLAAGEQAVRYQQALDDYAQAIGLAFQIRDDILDVIGDQRTMGKPQGADLRLEKSTYPALLGLENAQKLAIQLCHQAIEALSTIPYDSSLLQALANFIIDREC